MGCDAIALIKLQVAEEAGTFQQASEEVLAQRRILKARRPPPRADATPSAPSSNPFAGFSLVAPAAPSPAPTTPVEPSKAEETPKEPTEKSEEAKSADDAEKSVAADGKADEKAASAAIRLVELIYSYTSVLVVAYLRESSTL